MWIPSDYTDYTNDKCIANLSKILLIRCVEKSTRVDFKQNYERKETNVENQFKSPKGISQTTKFDKKKTTCLLTFGPYKLQTTGAGRLPITGWENKG